MPEVPVIERLRRCAAPSLSFAVFAVWLLNVGVGWLFRYYGTGLIFGKMLCLIICVDYILLAFLDFFYPRESIDIAPKFELAKWREVGFSFR